MIKNPQLKPNKVVRITCPSCGELQIKIYPWSTIQMTGTNYPPCKKCALKKSNSSLIKR